MKLVIEINMDNAAFVDAKYNGDEAARILRTLASRLRGINLEAGGDDMNLRDENGNTVGKARIE
jgi:hypothetical protein